MLSCWEERIYPKKELSTLGSGVTLTDLLNPTHIMVHPSLGQVLIRQGWEASLPDVELNKFVKVASAPRPIPKANNTWLGKDSFLPQKCVFWGLRGNPHLPPFAFIVLSLSKIVHSACMRSFWNLLTSHTLWYTLP